MSNWDGEPASALPAGLEGEYRLWSAVLLQAVQDYRLGPGHYRQRRDPGGKWRPVPRWEAYHSAQAFLESQACRDLLDVLGLDHEAFYASLSRPYERLMIHKAHA